MSYFVKLTVTVLGLLFVLNASSAFASTSACGPKPMADQGSSQIRLRSLLNSIPRFITDVREAASVGEKVAEFVRCEAAGDGSKFAKLFYIALTENPMFYQTEEFFYQTFLHDTFVSAQEVVMSNADREMIKQAFAAASQQRSKHKAPSYSQEQYKGLLWGS